MPRREECSHRRSPLTYQKTEYARFGYPERAVLDSTAFMDVLEQSEKLEMPQNLQPLDTRKGGRQRSQSGDVQGL